MRLEVHKTYQCTSWRYHTHQATIDAYYFCYCFNVLSRLRIVVWSNFACSKPLVTACFRSRLLQDSSSTFTPPTAPVTPDSSDPGLYFPVVAIVIIVVVVCVFVLAAAFIILKCLQVSRQLVAGSACTITVFLTFCLPNKDAQALMLYMQYLSDALSVLAWAIHSRCLHLTASYMYSCVCGVATLQSHPRVARPTLYGETNKPGYVRPCNPQCMHGT